MNLVSLLEALLFVTPKPLSISRLAELTKVAETEVEAAVQELALYYQEQERGLQLINHQAKWQMVSHPAAAAATAQLIKGEVASELTRPSLETLTIIAYRGPIKKNDLDKIRGVNCSMILRNLLLRGLVEAKEDTQGESSYSVSFEFLKFLGIAQVTELPDYERLNSAAALQVEAATDQLADS